MPFWRITPVAGLSDPRWQNSSIWEEVVVEADNAALARTVAASLDTQEPPPLPQVDDVRSRFVDEKLYRVDAVDPAELAGDVLARADVASSEDGRIIAQRKAARHPG